MRAHTITTMIVVGVCALAIPASASGNPAPDVNSGYAAHTTGIGSSDSGYAARTPGEISHQRALMAIPSVRQAVALERRRLVSGSPAETADGFDWASAAVGAGAALALVALGGAGFLTVRRRTGVSPSAASMS